MRKKQWSVFQFIFDFLFTAPLQAWFAVVKGFVVVVVMDSQGKAPQAVLAIEASIGQHYETLSQIKASRLWLADHNTSHTEWLVARFIEHLQLKKEDYLVDLGGGRL